MIAPDFDLHMTIARLIVDVPQLAVLSNAAFHAIEETVREPIRCGTLLSVGLGRHSRAKNGRGEGAHYRGRNTGPLLAPAVGQRVEAFVKVVQRAPVRIRLAATDGPLRPGLSAGVTVSVR